MALHDSMPTPNPRPEHARMPGSGARIAGDMRRIPNLAKALGESCDSLIGGPEPFETAAECADGAGPDVGRPRADRL
jgi:hypothetical protein